MMAVGSARVELTSPAAIAAEFGDAAAEASGRREYLAALEVVVGSLADAARHLSDPANKIYIATMEAGLYEVDVHSLAVTGLLKDRMNKP